jgi:uncharacterized protein YndB with AHSA1/START domain
VKNIVVEPVRKQIVVAAPQERAFRVFTQNVDAWWPKSHHIGKTPMKAAVIEPKVGGRWYEVGEDGAECDWGKVLVWEAPRRIVLCWQISAEWKYDATLETEVEVTFTAEGSRSTRVNLEHRNLERFGEAADKLRTSFDSPGGWAGILESFAGKAAG